jgi:PKD repeat protein
MKKRYFILFSLVLLFAGCKPDVESCFTFSANDAVVTFASTCSIEGTAFDWEFGDGESSISANPTHTYATSGTYTVTLRVTDKKGRTSTSSQTVVVVACAATCINGECVNGNCICDLGYEGVDCGTAVNAKFSGTYSLSETCNPSGAAGPYAIAVSPKSGSLVEVTFVGLWEIPANVVTAVVANSGLNFTIARQPIYSGFEIQSSSGSITADGSTINLAYTIYTDSTGTPSDACTAVLSK